MSYLKAISPFLFVLTLLSCSQDQGSTVIVKLQLKNNPEVQYAYLDLIEMNSDQLKVTDTIRMIPGDAEYELNGIAGGADDLYRIRFDKANDFVMLVADQNSLSVSIDWKDFSSYYTNSAASNSAKSLMSGFSKRLTDLEPLRNAIDSLQSMRGVDSLLRVQEENYTKVVSDIEDYLMAYADSSKNPTVALYAVGLGSGQMSIEKLKPVMLGMAKRFADNPRVTSITTQFFNSLQEQEKKNLIGQMAPEFSLPDMSGKPVSLSSFRGKFLLIDFWASWCGPCRAENPNVVAAFQKYKYKNFTILGVSLDREKGPWQQAVRDDKLEWAHVSDLKFWSSAVVPLYHIEGIPFNVLLDPQGKVLEMNLRGPALEAALARHIK